MDGCSVCRLVCRLVYRIGRSTGWAGVREWVVKLFYQSLKRQKGKALSHTHTYTHTFGSVLTYVHLLRVRIVYAHPHGKVIVADSLSGRFNILDCFAIA